MVGEGLWPQGPKQDLLQVQFRCLVLCYFFALWSWANHFPNPSLSFPISEKNMSTHLEEVCKRGWGRSQVSTGDRHHRTF